MGADPQHDEEGPVMRCKNCGRKIERGPLRGALPWVHLTDAGVAGWQLCRLGGQKLGTMAEPTREGVE